MKIWAKTLEKDKIKNDTIYYSNNSFSIDEFENSLTEICYILDIPKPIVLATHVKNFILFNSTTFIVDDFVESIHFEKLVLELCKS